MITLEIQLDEQISSYKRLLRFMLSCHQWDGLKWSTIESWIENFPNELPGRYYVARILSQLLYYSEEDLEQMLREGIYNKILGGERIAQKQITSSFSISQHDLRYELENELRSTLFVPLLDVGAPYESGNQVARVLVQRLGISTGQIMTTREIGDFGGRFNRLVIVDDCIGSGDQCRNFWMETTIPDGRLLSQWCADEGIEPYYLVLVGYKENIETLASELNDLKICCVELLQNENRVFGEKSMFWDNDEERINAKSYFKSILDQFGIPIGGYKGMDFAVIMHLTIPDWTLPMFWRGSNDWNILMRRKNSFD